MAHFEAHGMEPQALSAQVLGNGAVQRPFPMGGVANDGVGDVLHVAAQLVTPTGQGLQFHLGPAGAGKGAVTQQQFSPAQCSEARLGGLHFYALTAHVVRHAF
jgi:site-specific recombinase XerD